MFGPFGSDSFYFLFFPFAFLLLGPVKIYAQNCLQAPAE